MSLAETWISQFRKKSFRQLVSNFRNEYISKGIDETDLKSNPIDQFEDWFNEAVNNKLREPNVMYLSTVSADGKPSGRIMLLKGLTREDLFFIRTMKAGKQ